jgi:hypothetical protein
LLSLIATAGGGDLIAAAVDVAAAGWPVAAVNDQMTNDQLQMTKQSDRSSPRRSTQRSEARAMSPQHSHN